MNENTDRPIPEIPEFPVTDDDEPEEPAEPTEDPAAQQRRLLEDAERRGYLKGRNEMINRMMDSPQLFADLARLSSPESPEPARDNPADSFLAHIRPRIWD